METDEAKQSKSASREAAERVQADGRSLTCLEIRIRGEPVKYLLDFNRPCQRLIFDWCQDGLLYEFPTVLALDQVLNPGDTFLDVGAHVGFFTLIAARMVAPGGHVVAFEPNSVNFDFLRLNVRANGFENITLVNAALGESEGTVTLFENLDNDGGHALWRPALHPMNLRSQGHDRSSTVAQTTIDSVAERLGLTNIKAVKIDTEGAEARVVQGGRKRLADRGISLVICEHHRFALHAMGACAGDLLRFFYSNGYEGYISSNGVDFAEISVDAGFQPSARWKEEHRERAENVFFIRKESFSWPGVLRVSSSESAGGE